jgi:hypothetical protein
MSHNVGDPWPYGPQWPAAPFIATTIQPRVMPVNVPFSTFGVTVVVMDRDGNITVKVDQIAADTGGDT